MLDHQNNYVNKNSVMSNDAKSFDYNNQLTIILNNYYDSLTKLFLDCLTNAKFLDNKTVFSIWNIIFDTVVSARKKRSNCFQYDDMFTITNDMCEQLD